MTGDLIETFKIIYGISKYGRHFQNISPLTTFTVKVDFKYYVCKPIIFILLRE